MSGLRPDPGSAGSTGANSTMNVNTHWANWFFFDVVFSSFFFFFFFFFFFRVQTLRFFITGRPLRGCSSTGDTNWRLTLLLSVQSIKSPAGSSASRTSDAASASTSSSSSSSSAAAAAAAAVGRHSCSSSSPPAVLKQHRRQDAGTLKKFGLHYYHIITL